MGLKDPALEGLNWWDDFRAGSRILLQVCAESPVLSGIILALNVGLSVTDADWLPAAGMAMLSSFLCTALTLKVLYYAAARDSDCVADRLVDWNVYPKTIVLTGLLAVVSFVGLVAFVVPSIWFDVATSTTLMFLCLEKRGMLESVKQSFSLTKGHVLAIFKYLGPPAILFSLIPELGSLGWTLLAYHTDLSNLPTTQIDAAVSLASGLLDSWTWVALIPMQLAVYKRLKDAKAAVQDSAGL